MNREDQITDMLMERQRFIVGKLPAYFKVTSIIAIMGFFASFIIRFTNDPVMSGGIHDAIRRVGSQVTVPSVVAFTLGMVSSYLIWLFIIWALTFSSFIAFQAHRASKIVVSKLRCKPIRWLQLYAATFFPMIVFAVLWDSVESGPSAGLTLKISSPLEVLWLVFGTGIVIASIWLGNKFIPARLAAVRLSLFSLLLFLSLFLTYGCHITIASHSMVFGILLYIMCRSNEFSDLARRLSLHDIDTSLADHIDAIVVRYQELENLKSETVLKKAEHDASAEKKKMELEMAQASSDQNLAGQLTEIHARKVSLAERLNTAQLDVVDSKIDTLSQVFTILHEEVKNRVSTGIPAQIEALREEVKTMTPEQISQKMNELTRTITANLSGIPESLEEVRRQLHVTTRELERQTKMMADHRHEDAMLEEEVTPSSSATTAPQQSPGASGSFDENAEFPSSKLQQTKGEEAKGPPYIIPLPSTNPSRK